MIRNKVFTGIIMAVTGCLIFYLLTYSTGKIGEDAARAFNGHSLQYFPSVFLEGVAVAFCYIRLRWVTNKWIAILAPALLFAGAHLHYSIDAHKSLAYTLSFFLFNMAVVSGILFMLQRIRDIIWIGILHYFMDVAIHAFNQ